MIEKIEKSNINVSVNGIVVPDVGTEVSSARHTETMHEIITKVPSWIIRWGIMLFFFILLIAVAISVLVSYPDTIKAGLQIESINNSKSIIAKEGGIISKLLVTSNHQVKKGQQLAFINNPDIPNKNIVLTSPQDGRIAFISIVEEGYFLKANQEVFRIASNNEQFFGTIQIPQSYINKIKEGQKVLVKLNNYPVEEYGYINGKISYIADEPTKEGLLIMKISFSPSDLKKSIKLKSWMTGNAEIITEDVSLLSRVYNNITKKL